MEVQVERAVNKEKLILHMADLHPMIHDAITKSRKRAKEHLSKSLLPNFTEEDYILVVRDGFFESEKLCLRWRDLHRILKVHNGFVFDVEDLRSGDINPIHRP